MPIAETITCDRGTQTTPPATPAATEQPATPIQEGPPYKHWPAYPWPYEPQLPDIAPPSGTIGISLQTLDTFLRTKPHMSDEETHWHGAKFLGNGSYGAVGLWCEVDEHGNVIDRMVVKDNHAVNRAAWRDPKYWRDNLPREIAINRRIESRRTAEPEACQNIVKYRGHRLLMGQCRYRLYTDFASGGNIAEAMMPYHERWDGIEMSRVPTERFLPEAFIWHTIKALATACLLLETGTLGDTPVDDWKPIFHLDFQTPNILLDVQSKKRKAPAEEEPEAIPPSAGPIKRLKGREAAAKVVIDARSSSTTANTSQDLKIIVPKLADFGLSFYDLDFSECPAMDENPRDYTLTSTDNRYAPEHHHYDPKSPKRLDNKTDVWGIGRIAWSLIVNKLEAHGPLRDGGFQDEDLGGPLPISQIASPNMHINDYYESQLLVGSNDWPAARKYSEELKDLVRDCLRFWQDNRPSPRDVLNRVNRHLEAHPGLVDGAMDAGRTLLSLNDNRGAEVGDILIGRPGV